jgi:hypothetical protein
MIQLLSHTYFEGTEKAMSECESIKILRENLAYIPKQTRRASLPTRSKPYSYRKTIGPQNRISQPRNTAEER